MYTRTEKPPFGTPLNWSHPLVSRFQLRHAYLFNEPAGTAAINSAYPLVAGPRTGTLGSGATFRAGNGTSYDASTTAYVDIGANTDLVGPLTVLCRFRTATLTGLRTFWGMNTTGGAERVTGSRYIESNKISYWEGSGNDRVLAGTKTLAIGQWYTDALVRSGAAGSMTLTSYIDGQQDDTNTTARTPSTSSAGALRVGFAGAFTGAPWSGLIDWFLLFVSALPPPCIYSLMDDPYQLWQRKRRATFAGVAAAPPAGNRRRRVLICGGD